MNGLFSVPATPVVPVLAEATFNHLAYGWRAMSAQAVTRRVTYIPEHWRVAGAGRHFNRRLFQQIVERSAADAGYRRDSLFKRCRRNLSGPGFR